MSVSRITAIIAPGPATEGTASGKDGQIPPRFGRSGFRIHSSEEHLQTEEEKDDPACNFERVQVNADGI
jgi:hypothetical protein